MRLGELMLSLEQVRHIQQEVKAKLDRIERDRSIEAAISESEVWIEQVSRDSGQSSHFRLLFICLGALVRISRGVRIPRHHSEKFLKIAETALKLCQIPSDSVSFKWVHEDFHFIRAMLMRRQGRHLESAWSLKFAERFSAIKAQEMAALQSLSWGIRCLRLGFVPGALSAFDDAATKGIPEANAALWATNVLKTLRLSFQWEEHSRNLRDFLKRFDDDATIQELKWEESMATAMQSGSYGSIYGLLSKGKPHWRNKTYLLEGWLLAHCHQEKKYIERVATPTAISKMEGFKAAEQGGLFGCAKNLEYCYDTDVPFPIRVEKSLEILQEASEAISIDEELMIVGALTRWLNRNRLNDLAAVSLNQYQMYCSQLTSGKASDIYGLLGDVIHAQDRQPLKIAK